MPTKKELKTLYEKGVGMRNMCHLLKTSGWWVWSGETRGSSSAWYLGFNFGDRSWYGRDNSTMLLLASIPMALAVFRRKFRKS